MPLLSSPRPFHFLGIALIRGLAMSAAAKASDNLAEYQVGQLCPMLRFTDSMAGRGICRISMESRC
jgi:hypothetical protein